MMLGGRNLLPQPVLKTVTDHECDSQGMRYADVFDAQAVGFKVQVRWFHQRPAREFFIFTYVQVVSWQGHVLTC